MISSLCVSALGAEGRRPTRHALVHSAAMPEVGLKEPLSLPGPPLPLHCPRTPAAQLKATRLRPFRLAGAPPPGLAGAPPPGLAGAPPPGLSEAPHLAALMPTLQPRAGRPRRDLSPRPLSSSSSRPRPRTPPALSSLMHHPRLSASLWTSSCCSCVATAGPLAFRVAANAARQERRTHCRQKLLLAR